MSDSEEHYRKIDEREKARVVEEKRLFEASVSAWREKVLAQANGDLIPFVVSDGREFMVPRVPFLRWALTIHGWHLLPAWERVAPSGLKLYNDDCDHTDWMIGGGIDLHSWYGNRKYGIEQDKALVHSALDRQWEIQCEMLNFKAAVLCGTGAVEGTVIHPKPNKGLELKLGQPDENGHRISNSTHEKVRVIVIPHAGPEYVQAAMEIHARGGAIITEQGGAMAHLVNIGREQNLRIVRVKDAMKLYRDSTAPVRVDCDKGEVTLIVP